MSADVLQFPFMASELPNRIRELREASGLSQQALADRLNCSKMLISSMERGKHQLTLHWMQRIAREFGVSAADLLTEDDNPLATREDERELLERYRAGSADQKESIQKVAEALIPFHAQTSEAA